MTTALIFAGGTGRRMNSRSKPKQFLEMHGKPIIIYTLEYFEYHDDVDTIVVVCIREWIDELKGLLKRFGISKVSRIVAITSETARESIVRSTDGEIICEVPPRSQMYTAKAPQTFYYGKILDLYERAKRDGKKSIDSAHLCNLYGEAMHIVVSTPNNIKITEPADYYIYRALYEAMEGQQIFGL